jgi:hypothetical protein
MGTDIIKRQLAALQLSPGEAIVVGSGILEVLGIRESQDLDLMISEPVFWRIANTELLSVILYPDGTNGLNLDAVELMYSWLGRTVEDITPHVIEIDGVQFLSLTGLRAMKLEHGRAKDLRDVELIDQYLAAH